MEVAANNTCGWQIELNHVLPSARMATAVGTLPVVMVQATSTASVLAAVNELQHTLTVHQALC